VPELPDYGVTIGIRQLLHHTSGVRDVWSVMDLMGWPEPWPCDPRALVDILARQPRLNFDPGTDFCYSNSGYILLGLIVERVTQSSLSAFCAETLFNPLGLTSMVLAPAGVASPAGSTRRYAIVDGVPRPGSDAWVQDDRAGRWPLIPWLVVAISSRPWVPRHRRFRTARPGSSGSGTPPVRRRRCHNRQLGGVDKA